MASCIEAFRGGSQLISKIQIRGRCSRYSLRIADSRFGSSRFKLKPTAPAWEEYRRPLLSGRRSETTLHSAGRPLSILQRTWRSNGELVIRSTVGALVTMEVVEKQSIGPLAFFCAQQRFASMMICPRCNGLVDRRCAMKSIMASLER